MVSASNVEAGDEIEEDSKLGTSPNCSTIKGPTSVNVPTSQREPPDEINPRGNFMNSLTVPAKFRLFTKERDDMSRSVVSTIEKEFRKHFSVLLSRKINWVSLKEIFKEWIQKPMNMVSFAWVIFVAISSFLLLLVRTGMLNHALPKESQRETWIEVNNQIHNALFTLMCLYQHPKCFHHLVYLCRWSIDDVLKLRKLYCKQGTYKPHEWFHILVVVVLLHINCFAQYVLCGLNVGYGRSQRPKIGVGLCIAVTIAAQSIAWLYGIITPLGRDYESEIDCEAESQISKVDEPVNLRREAFEKKYSFVKRDDQNVAECRPEWRGGLFNLWEDISVAYLSMFCFLCVFGWNMERLGFGNMYVHIATFLLLCMAPFWVFNLAAVNIDNDTVREALGVTGIILCVFGLLYGGFWRIQIRKRLNLPGNDFFFGYPAVIDCMQWLCCCTCSLAQEVRTGDFYDIVEDKFYKKQMEDGFCATLSSHPHEDGSSYLKSGPSSPDQCNSGPSKFQMVSSPSSSRLAKGYGLEGQFDMVKEELSVRSSIMTPPAQEVGTGDFYDVEEDKLYKKQMEDSLHATLSSHPHEDGSSYLKSGPSSPDQSNSSPSKFQMVSSPSSSRLGKGYGLEGQFDMVKEESSVRSSIMTPPAPSLIENRSLPNENGRQLQCVVEDSSCKYI